MSSRATRRVGRTPSREARLRFTCQSTSGQRLETPSRLALGRRDQAILELFYASGLRLSELTGLDLDDLNLSARMVRVLGKGRKERLVPMTQTAADAIRTYLKDREMMVQGAGSRVQGAGSRVQGAGSRVRGPGSAVEHPLFVNYRGQRLTPRSVHRLVRRYVALCSTRFGISPTPCSFLCTNCGGGEMCVHRSCWPRAASTTRLHTRQCCAPHRVTARQPSAKRAPIDGLGWLRRGMQQSLRDPSLRRPLEALFARRRAPVGGNAVHVLLDGTNTALAPGH